MAFRHVTRRVPFARCFAAETMEFKAETRKLLDIVAKSLYTDKEVFIRELISNASDACEKRRFLQNTNAAPMAEDPIRIRVEADENERMFIIEDTGVGMTREELIRNIGTIAKSGSLDFVNDDSIGAGDKANAIIGQFGVGFYSSFVVADKVEVFTKSAVDTNAPGYRWESNGEGSFTIDEHEGLSAGTKIVVHLKEDAAEFSKTTVVKKAASKFSNFIDFPIMLAESGDDKELNKQGALWMKANPTDEEHLNFYRHLNNSSYGEPFFTMKFSTDAPLTINAVFYVQEDAPSRFFAKEPDVGVALYSRRVLVKKHADGVIPKWMHWVKGVVDCEDMPLNISRENMQDTRLMEKLSAAVVRRFLKYLHRQSVNEPTKYLTFIKNYAYYIKIGLIDDKDNNNARLKDDLVRLLRYECTNKEAGEVISLEDYVDSAKEGQKNIYYLCAPDRKTALSSPHMEQFTARNRNVILMYDDVDEFLVSSGMDAFKEMKFVSIDAQDKDFELNLDTPEETKEEIKLQEGDQKEMVNFIKGVLGNKVQDVKFTDRLVNSPAAATSLLTPHMRKMMKNMMQGAGKETPDNVPVTLELSARHHLTATIWHIHKTNPDVAKQAVDTLFDSAMIAAGLLDEPRMVLSRLNKLLEMFVYQGAGYNYTERKYAHEMVGETGENTEQRENVAEPMENVAEQKENVAEEKEKVAEGKVNVDEKGKVAAEPKVVAY